MPTSKETMDYFLDQMAQAGDVKARRMFGNYAIYCNNKVVGLACDDQIFIKITTISGNYLDSTHWAPPFPGAKSFLQVPEEKWEDRDWLSSFIKDTANNLPVLKTKKYSTGR